MKSLFCSGDALEFRKFRIAIACFVLIVLLVGCGPKPSDPTLSAAHYRTGKVRMEKGDYAGALKAFRKALKNNPDHAPSLKSAGVCFMNIGQSDSAIVYFEGAIVNNPRDNEPYVKIGDIYYERFNFHEAMTYYDRALEIGSIPAKAYERLGDIYYRWREYGRAREYYNKAVAADSTAGGAGYMLGLTMLMQGDTLAALYRFEDAFTKGGVTAAAYSIGLIYFNRRDHFESIKWLQRYLEREAEGSLADKARRLLNEIKEVRPPNPDGDSKRDSGSFPPNSP